MVWHVRNAIATVVGLFVPLESGCARARSNDQVSKGVIKVSLFSPATLLTGSNPHP